MNAPFIAFIPLSNWLRGFDRYAMRYSKAHIGESRFKDAFYLLREDEAWTPGLSKARRLVEKLGLRGDRVVALRAQLPVGDDGIRPNDVTGTGIGWRWPKPEVKLSGVAWVNDDGALVPTRHEDVTAHAFQLAPEVEWSDCRPRSFSVLPVAKACQAKCAFCFSKASVSDLERQQSASLELFTQWADEALRRGAERAVITGGGEPTLLPLPKLVELVRMLSARFPKTLLISNGAKLELPALRDAGLTTLAISRHGLDAEHDARVMGLAVDSAARAKESRALGIRTRAICVLQKNGVARVDDVIAYVRRSAREGFHEVCFKELYVSSTSENPWAPSAVNQFCEANQVPLSVVLEAMQQLGFAQVDELPWGSPVFEGEGVRVAAYTEPSVGWERAHRLVRSWNVMADGQCFASLEDPKSSLSLRSGERAEGARSVASLNDSPSPRSTLEEFLKRRDELRASHPGLLDCSELNLYRSLAPRFPAIAPSSHREAPYRCHLAESFLAHLQLPAEWKSRTHVSHGVRRSLRALFEVFARDGVRVAIPSDVYPVYLQHARESGVQFTTFTQFPQQLDDVDALLLCEPSKPWGTTLSANELATLLKWNGLVVLDSAYATPPTSGALQLLHEGRAMLLASLSKSWLIPDHGGICITPRGEWFERTRATFTALPKDEAKVRIAYAALTEHASRPTHVRDVLSTRARMLDELTRARPELKASACSGYFAVSTRPFDELLGLGVLGVPASVFGATTPYTILSSLEPVRGISGLQLQS